MRTHQTLTLIALTAIITALTTTAIITYTRPATTIQLYTYYTTHIQTIGESWEDWSTENMHKPLHQIITENSWRQK